MAPVTRRSPVWRRAVVLMTHGKAARQACSMAWPLSSSGGRRRSTTKNRRAARKIWEMQTNSGSVSGWNNSDRSGSKWPSLLVGFGPFLALVGSLQILGGFFLRFVGIVVLSHRQVVFVNRAVALAAGLAQWENHRNGQRHAQKRRLHRLPEEARRRLSGAPEDPPGVGQPFRAHLQRDAELLGDHAAALRLRVYTDPRLVAESHREPIQQDGSNDAARNPSGQQARANRSHSSILRGDQRRSAGLSLEVQDGRNIHCIVISRTVI